MAKKNKERQFAVLGLGRFGTSVALTLHELGYQVLGVDSDEEIVQDLSHELTHVVSADASDENTLRSLGINNYDVVIVGIGPLDTNEFNSANNFKIFPNPATDNFTIETENDIKSVEIYSIQGQKVVTSTSKNIDVSNLSKGMYMVRIEDENNAVATQKLIIK